MREVLIFFCQALVFLLEYNPFKSYLFTLNLKKFIVRYRAGIIFINAIVLILEIVFAVKGKDFSLLLVISVLVCGMFFFVAEIFSKKKFFCILQNEINCLSEEVLQTQDVHLIRNAIAKTFDKMYMLSDIEKAMYQRGTKNKEEDGARWRNPPRFLFRFFSSLDKFVSYDIIK